MARRQARDKLGRFAPGRLSFSLAYHNTSPSAAAGIRAGGYRASTEGAQGAGVYTSTSRRQARQYGEAGLTHRIPKGRVVKEKPLKTAASVKRRYSSLSAGSAVRVTGTADKIMLMNERMANRTLVKPSSTIRSPRKPRGGK